MERAAAARAADGGTREGRRAQLQLAAGVAVAVVLADQASKALVRARLPERQSWPEGFELIRIAHVENSGAAFGILQGAGPLLIACSIAGVAAALWFLRASPAGDRAGGAAIALVLGGAIGNLIDRLFRGTVTDFIDPAHYPAFNVADSAIVVGVLALAALSLRGRDGGAAEDERSGEAGAGEGGR